MTRLHFVAFRPLAFALLAVALSLLSVQPAFAATGASPDGIYWCLGEASSENNFPIPWTTTDDNWTPPPLSAATDTNGYDDYLVQVNYWDSWQSNSSLGYSHGVVCIDYQTDSSGKPTGSFTIVHAGLPGVPRTAANCAAATADGVAGPGTCIDENAWAAANPTLFPWWGNNNFHYPDTYLSPTFVSQYYNGVTGPSTDAGPTAYPSVWKGCSWDALSGCTTGAKFIDDGGNPDGGNPNTFPKQLQYITSLPSTWNINYPASVGTRTDPTQVWDAGYDIWFDTTGDEDTGKATYSGGGRGQNDGLEIMVWMDHNHSYVDGGKDVAGFAQPSGWPREQVNIDNVVYDVWTSRLNNPYFGRLTSTVIPADADPSTCPTLQGATCGTEWNVVTFVATAPYRSQGMSLDAKVFTDYILGVNDGLYTINTTPASGSTRDTSTGTYYGGLLCPNSAMYHDASGLPDFSAVAGATRDCLQQSWWLTSVQAGFEPWVGGVDYTIPAGNIGTPRGLQSVSFQVHDWSTSTTVQSGVMSGQSTPVVYWNAPFNVVYSGCTTYSASNSASFSIALPDGSTYPTTGTQPMGAQDPTTLLFTYTIQKLYPLHGQATITFTSSCGTVILPIYIDPSGQVFYSDGKTPVVGATVTLLHSASGSASGPFTAVPSRNLGLASPVMQPTGNTLNPMPTDKYGDYGWNVAPGSYEVQAQKIGCGSVTSAVQHVTTTPIMSLNLDLTCAAPTPPPPPPPSNPVTVQLTYNGTPWATGYCENVILTNTSSKPVTWKVNFTLPYKGSITSNWNLNYTVSGQVVTAWGVGYNNVLQPGQVSNSIGFCASR